MTSLLVGKLAADSDIQPILGQMATAGDDFDPLPLLQRGRAGAALLLDRLLPESAGLGSIADSGPEIAIRVQQLGDVSYHVRETATQKLITLGPVVRERMEAAAHNDDPEIATRAKFVLEHIQPPASDKPEPEAVRNVTAAYGAAFSVYLAGLRDADALQLLARRTMAALKAGRERTNSGFDFVEQAVTIVVRTQDDALIGLFKPALELEPEERAVWIVGVIGANRPHGFVPGLLREAARSRRSGVAREANAWQREVGPNAKRFHISSMKVGFMMRGEYEGVYEVDDDYVIVQLSRGMVVRTKTPCEGREIFDSLEAGLACIAQGNGWTVVNQSNCLPIRKIVRVGDEVSLINTRFVIPRKGIQNLSEHWLVFETKCRGIDDAKNCYHDVGMCYAHSEHDIFKN